MGRAPIRVNEHFVVVEDENGNEADVIYDPPLLADVGNLKVELRKELNHSMPHVHIVKKCGKNEYDVSIAIDDLKVLAGDKNRKYFDPREYQQTLEFILENQERLETLYKKLRGDL